MGRSNPGHCVRKQLSSPRLLVLYPQVPQSVRSLKTILPTSRPPLTVTRTTWLHDNNVFTFYPSPRAAVYLLFCCDPACWNTVCAAPPLSLPAALDCPLVAPSHRPLVRSVSALRLLLLVNTHYGWRLRAGKGIAETYCLLLPKIQGPSGDSTAHIG